MVTANTGKFAFERCTDVHDEAVVANVGRGEFHVNWETLRSPTNAARRCPLPQDDIGSAAAFSFGDLEDLRFEI